MTARDGRVIGVDASNIRGGGGVTHLTRLLTAADPAAAGISRMIVWSVDATLAALPEASWLEKRPLGSFARSLPRRVFWQQWRLPRELVRNGCDLLFSPGGTLPWRVPVPAVTMSQNLLPFEPGEAARYRGRAMFWKLRLLRLAQGRSFRRADGVIFLTQYARRVVEAVIGRAVRRGCIVPHGVEPRFQRAARSGAGEGEFRLLYVSIVDVYKHQWNVARAVARLRREGRPVSIDFVGPAYPPALDRLRSVLAEEDPEGRFLRYRGAVPFEALHETYASADAFVFASSCENLPNILLEAMAAGLPIACSRRGPMPEVLGDAGVYFDPENVDSIEQALRALLDDPPGRQRFGAAAERASRSFTWESCSHATLAFLAEVAGGPAEVTGGGA